MGLAFKTCLLIDDDKDDQEIFILALKELDQLVHCITISSGMEAIKTLGAKTPLKPDIIFLDLNMPCMDGKQCLFEMRKMETLHHVPIIMYSTSSEQRDITESKQLGASTFLTKPNTVTQLSRCLSAIFKEHINSKEYVL